MQNAAARIFTKTNKKWASCLVLPSFHCFSVLFSINCHKCFSKAFNGMAAAMCIFLFPLPEKLIFNQILKYPLFWKRYSRGSLLQLWILGFHTITMFLIHLICGDEPQVTFHVKKWFNKTSINRTCSPFESVKLPVKHVWRSHDTAYHRVFNLVALQALCLDLSPSAYNVCFTVHQTTTLHRDP